MRAPSKALLFASLFGLILFAGCKDKLPTGIKMEAPIHRVISLSPSAAELLMLSSLQLVGRTAADDFPPANKNAPVVANIKPDYEKIAAIHPDLIVYDPSLYNEADIQKLKELHIPLATIEGDTVDDYTKSVYRLGQATQSETGFMDYIERLNKVVSESLSDPIKPAPKTVLVSPSLNSNPLVAGTKSFYADVVRIAGGEPVGPSSNRFEPMNAEALLALNPDAVVVAGRKGDYSAFTNDPRFAQLKAVKNGKILGVDDEYILRRGERVDEAIKRIHGGLIKLFK